MLNTKLPQPRAPHRLRSQRGAATLVTVMVLFFVLALMASFANRNLIFEQRITSNYLRTGIAAETAEAGLEWTLAMLNGGKVGNSCRADPLGSTFRQRFMSARAGYELDMDSRPADQPQAACVLSGANSWTCSCPPTGTPIAEPARDASRMQPGFRVMMTPFNPAEANQVRVTISACTSLPSDCDGRTLVTDAVGNAKVQADLAMLSALKMPPASPVIAGANVALGANAGLHNADIGSNGLLIQTHGDLTGGRERWTSTPGSPISDGIITGDTGLQAAGMFRKYFGMAATRYRDQPNVRQLACPADDCTAKLLELVNAGADVIWVNGNLTLTGNQVLGSATAPILLISTGAVTVNTPIQVWGVIYAQGAVSWSNASGMPSQLIGALITESTLTASGLVDFAYDTQVIGRLNRQRGAYVQVPGSWEQVR